jgi:hypothetical protein
MEQGMRESGMTPPTREKVKVIRYGLMVPFTRATGRMTRPMAEEGLSMRMEMYMKVNGRMTRLMVLEGTCTLTEHSTRDTGRRTSNMAKERKHGLMVHNMKGIM